jgi:small ligand-binding sensory domain FIST
MPPSITIAQSKPHKPAYKAVRAAGSDWRDVGQKLLQVIGKAQGPLPEYTTGFLFITERLAADAGSLLNLLQDVSGIKSWTGCSGLGVFDGTGISLDEVAACVLLANFPQNLVLPIPLQNQSELQLPDATTAWLTLHSPPFGIVFADPSMVGDLNAHLATLTHKTGAFLIGALTGGDQQAQIGKEASVGQFGGVLLAGSIYVQTAIAQGCLPVGGMHTVTGSHDNAITEIDDYPAIDAFTSDLRQMAMASLGKDPDQIIIDTEDPEAMLQLEDQFRDVFQGEIHIGVSITGSDRGDYVVRPIHAIDPDSEKLVTAEPVPQGTRIRFVRRDDDTMKADLDRMLEGMLNRLSEAPGKPQAALYISCVARAPMRGAESYELKRIREVLGDIPLAGFYAGGEIFREHMHSYTGILTLFF